MMLADFLAPRAAACCEAILAGLPVGYAERGRPFLKEWVEAQIQGFRGHPDRTSEWVALMMSIVQAEGGGLGEALEVAHTFRRGALQVCRGQRTGLTEDELYEVLLGLEERYIHEVSEYFSQAERETLASERRRLRVMAESMTAPFAMLDTEGLITLANGNLARELGVPVDGLPQQEFASFCDEATAAEMRRALRLKKSTRSAEFLGHLGGKGKQHGPFRFVIQPMFDAQGLRSGAGVALLSPEADTAEDTEFLGEAAEKIVGFLPVALQVFARDRRVVYSNGAAQEMLAGGEDKRRPICCRLSFSGVSSSFTCACDQVLATGKPFQSEGRFERDGVTRWFATAISPMRHEGQEVTHLAAAFREVTAQRILENEFLGRQKSSLASQVAVTVAHQLRNPLGVLIGFAEMLARGLPPEQVPGAVDKMLRNSIRCKEIVENLLEFGRGFPSERVPTELTTIIRETLQPMFTRAQSKRIEWRLPETAGPVDCVPNQLAQVFVSLLDNALRAAVQQVIFEVLPREDFVLIKIQDDGPGVPEGLRERVFEPFFTTRKQEGAIGLGLSLSQTVVTEYGGYLYLDEAAPGGCFVVQLPLSLETAEVSVPSETTPAAPPAERRLLVVDDEFDLLEMLAMVLEMRGFRVDTTGTAAEAIELLQRQVYDAVVLDVRLPGDLSGPQLYEYIAGTHPELARRTLFITADTMNLETRKFLDRVKRPSMEKPFLVYEFAAKVSQLLDESSI